MNRREMLENLTGVVAVAGMPATVKAIEPAPVCLVVKFSKHITSAQMGTISKTLEERLKIPVLCHGPEVEVTAVYKHERPAP